MRYPRGTLSGCSSAAPWCRTRTEAQLPRTSLLRQLRREIHDLPAHHRRERLQALDLLLGNREDVRRQHHQIGELPRLDRALDVLLEGEPGVVDREDPQRLLARDALVG